MKTFGIIFSCLTFVDLLLIIFGAIIEAGPNKNELGFCFNGCAVPLTHHGATYLSIKALYDMFTP